MKSLNELDFDLDDDFELSIGQVITSRNIVLEQGKSKPSSLAFIPEVTEEASFRATGFRRPNRGLTTQSSKNLDEEFKPSRKNLNETSYAEMKSVLGKMVKANDVKRDNNVSNVIY